MEDLEEEVSHASQTLTDMILIQVIESYIDSYQNHLRSLLVLIQYVGGKPEIPHFSQLSDYADAAGPWTTEWVHREIQIGNPSVDSETVKQDF